MAGKKRPCSKPKRKRCCPPGGHLSSFGFLNFLRKYRETHIGLSSLDAVRRCMVRWKRLSATDKKKYRQMKRPSKPKQPKKQINQRGQLKKGQFFEYLRTFRQNNLDMPNSEMIMKSVEIWTKMSTEQQALYCDRIRHSKHAVHPVSGPNTIYLL
ncbi:uncharacterized protein LOC119671806 [Teleopsis dalmanni]|uniref:uncharacterized protein LOC119671806 n=1 Tax=Teleopsis dalmanni TaxID=139649 RepID=UPI0018CE6E56|nr:uncharacterized protein LOC119671806 [Teleopsis dalmanni]